MFKKIAAFLAAVFTFMLYCSMPLMSHADNENLASGYFEETIDSSDFVSPYNQQTYDQYGYFGHFVPTSNFPYYISWFAANKGNRSYIQSGTWRVRLSDDSGVTVNSTNVGINFVFETPVTVFSQTNYWLWSSNRWTKSTSNINVNYDNITLIEFDFDNANFNLYQGLVPVETGALDPTIQRYLYELRTNLDYELPAALSLGITFDPLLYGEISRSSTWNGKQYTSDTLDLIISNNGDDAQFAWFIVPHGGSISFPSSIAQNSQGFLGNPVYAYVTDEWVSLGSSSATPDVYSPCAWHTIPSGYSNQYYHVPWSSMKLEKGVTYDTVVYAKVIEGTTNHSPTFSRGSYSVSSDLTEVTEVYRSSFSITDPLEYKAQNDGFEVHPWDPDIDNSSLFSSQSAWTDNEGNVYIKGQGNGNGNNIVSGGWGNTQFTANRAFQNVFGFLSAALSYFPSEWLAVLSFGFTAIIIFFIVKVVAHS